MAGRFTVEAAFKAIDQFSSVVSGIQSRTERMLKGINSSVHDLNGVADKAIGGLKAIGAAALAAGTVAGAGLAHIIHTGADFEQSITNVGAVMGKTRVQIADLEKEAMRLGVVTQFSSSEVAEAMEMMAKKGFDAEEILQGIPGVLNAIAASGQGMAEVSTVVGSTIRGFGLEAKEAGRVANILAFTAEKTGATITDLGVAISNAAPTAKTLGVSIEDTAAAVGLLQKTGIDASTAGTAVATMLAKITKPSKDAAQQMAAMGVKFKDAKGNALPFVQILGQLVKAGDKAGGNMDRMAFLAELVGLRGDKAAIALSDMAKSGDFQKLVEGIKNTGDYAEKVAKIRLDTTQGSWKLLLSTVEVLETKLFNLQSGPLRGVIDKVNAWVAANQDLIVQKVQDTIASIAEHMPDIVRWGERLGKVAIVFGGMVLAIKAASAALAIFNFLVSANPITLVVLAVAAAAAAIYAFWPEISAFFGRIWKGIKEIAANVASAISGAAQAIWEPLKGFLVAALEVAVGLFTALFPGVVAAGRIAFTALADFGSWLISKWGPIKEFFAGVWGSIKAGFVAAMNALAPIALAVLNKVKAIWEPIGAFFSELWEGISNGFKKALGWAVDKIESIVSTLRKLGHDVLNGGGPGSSQEAPAPGDAGGPAPEPQVVPPRASMPMGEQHAFLEQRDSVDVNIVDKTSGRVQIPRFPSSGRVRLNLTPSGSFA